MVNLAVSYRDGHGVSQDYTSAMDWFQKAVASGNSDAQFGIGALYLNGQGVPVDNAMGLQWLQKAAEGGNSGAATAVGDAYVMGKVVPQDYAKAMTFLQRGASLWKRNGNGTSGWFICHGVGCGSRRCKGCRVVSKGRGGGVRVSNDEFRRLLYDGEGYANRTMRSRWIGLNAPQVLQTGDTAAMLKIALMYRDGTGVAKDEGKMLEWLKKSADLGNEDAKTLLKELN